VSEDLKKALRDRASKIVVLFGIVSLLGDFKYEGFRSILPVLVESLGGTLVALGFAWGIGEFLSYGLRLPFGVIADRSRRYWLMVWTGYMATAISIPSIGLVKSLSALVGLYSVDRIGKAARTPARDALISELRGIGTGRAFGLHRAIDQAGAILGPLVAGLVISITNDPRLFLLLLVVPAVVQVAVLLVTQREWVRQGYTIPLQRGWNELRFAELKGTIPIMLALMLFGLGLFQIPFVLSELSQSQMPLAYALAQVCYIILAMVWGALLDRVGIAIMLLVYLIACIVPTAMLVSPFLAAAVWGASWSLHEVGFRFVLAKLVPTGRRAAAFGLYAFIFGIATMAGSIVLGGLLEISLHYGVLYAIGVQAVGFATFYAILKRRVGGALVSSR